MIPLRLSRPQHFKPQAFSAVYTSFHSFNVTDPIQDYCMMEPSTNTPSQWLFSVAALNETPSTFPLEKEMYDRARGVEFLYRLGSSLAL